MQAIIVAGGRGERLRPITDKIPKPMVEVGGKSILEYTVDLLRNNGVTDLIFALCYLPNVIVEHFGDGSNFGVNIRYTYEDKNNPLGTAGAILDSRDHTRGDFIVTYADILRELNVEEMIDKHRMNKAFATLNVYKRFGENPKSMVVFGNENKICDFKERPLLEEFDNDFVWANGSFYIFNQRIFDYISKGCKTDFGKDVFPMLLKKKEDVFAYPTDGYFIDIGNLEKLEKARQTFIIQ